MANHTRKRPTKKVVKKTGEKIKKPVKTKPRNNGTMTEAAFWSWIRSWLRRRSLAWKPIYQCKENSKRAYKGPNKRQKYEYKCNECKKYFSAKDVSVDHKKPAGSLKSGDDLKTFVETLFCEQDNLQVLCNTCHDKKTIKDNKK